jgi:hypothetical protein
LGKTQNFISKDILQLLMGEVVNSRLSSDNSVNYSVELHEKEARVLKNRVHNVHLFNAGLCNVDAGIIERGKSLGAKYFVVPKSLRTRKKCKMTRVSYQKIETDDKVFFICVSRKDLLQQ